MSETEAIEHALHLHRRPRRPSRGVGMPLALSAAAMPGSEVTPVA
jgi:hypothetical protein